MNQYIPPALNGRKERKILENKSTHDPLDSVSSPPVIFGGIFGRRRSGPIATPPILQSQRANTVRLHIDFHFYASRSKYKVSLEYFGNPAVCAAFYQKHY